jgi:hypothetical protein
MRPVTELFGFLEKKTGIPAIYFMEKQMENARQFFGLTALPIFDPQKP